MTGRMSDEESHDNRLSNFLGCQNMATYVIETIHFVFSRCRVEFGSRRDNFELEVDGDARGDECEDLPRGLYVQLFIIILLIILTSP